MGSGELQTGQLFVSTRAVSPTRVPFILRQFLIFFFLTFFIYNHRNLAQFLNRICTILPTSEVAEVAIIRVITYYYAMVYPMTADEEPHLVY